MCAALNHGQIDQVCINLIHTQFGKISLLRYFVSCDLTESIPIKSNSIHSCWSKRAWSLTQRRSRRSS